MPSPKGVVVVSLLTSALLVASAGLAMWRWSQQPVDAGPTRVREQTYSQVQQNSQGGAPDPLGEVLSGGRPDFLRRQPGDGPLPVDPLELPRFEGATARQGLQRQTDRDLDQRVQYRVPDASAEQILQHYREAAIARGFQKIDRTGEASLIQETFTRRTADGKNEQLTISVSQYAAPPSVLIWYTQLRRTP